ncbi:globin domain-containing protein [Kitasatospora sp. NPDC002227]|uniref:globin domain-containing protein n=1 Tax=Kitasatospora sp. NPDC002227 TaxID=3154773 RepID=UPI00331A12A9
MLSAQSAAVVKATLPVVAAAIEDITPLFYAKMFTAHPELLRDLFNRGNQANGTQRQALAGSIAAFASALVTEPAGLPDEMLARIAHKHASVGITPDQYEIVHTHLFEAIAEVLGDAVTPEVAAAWSEVYWLMADTLIAAERGLYQQAATEGGQVWRDWTVVDRLTRTADVVTFRVRPADGSPLPSFRPGQYVSVQVQLPDGAHQIRQYSLSGDPGDTLQFTVRRLTGTPAGEVSNHLYDHVLPGAVLRLSPPFGTVTLTDGDGPLLLASAGIGCTPMIGMLTHLAAARSTRRITVIHADRDERSHAFRTELAELVRALPGATAHVFYEHPTDDRPTDRTGLVDLTGIEIPDSTTAYLCGPLPFLRTVRAQLLNHGIHADAVHYELFGPDLWLPHLG